MAVLQAGSPPPLCQQVDARASPRQKAESAEQQGSLISHPTATTRALPVPFTAMNIHEHGLLALTQCTNWSRNVGKSSPLVFLSFQSCTHTHKVSFL